MPLRNFTEDLEYQANHGCDTTSPLPMIQPGYVASALNANVLHNGGFEKRSGYQPQLSSTWSTNAITGGIEFKRTGSSPVTILTGDNTYITTVGQVGSGSVTAITGLTFATGHRLDSIQFGNLLFFYNGYDNPKLWDGTAAVTPANVRQVGITAPTNAPTLNAVANNGGPTYTFTVAAANATAGAIYGNTATGQVYTVTTTIVGGLLLTTTGSGTPSTTGGSMTLVLISGTGDGTITYSAVVSTGSITGLVMQSQYIYAYTYYNSITGAESSPSPLFQILLEGSQNQVIINITSGIATTADTINIYRTVANGSVLFFDSNVGISSTPFTDNTADASLDYQMELDNTQITNYIDVTHPQAAIYPTVCRNRVFLKTNDNEVRFSKIGQFQPMPESFELKSVCSTMGIYGNEDYIVGLNSINGIPIVLKRKTIGRMEEQGLPDTTSSFDLVGYTYRELAEGYGAVSHYAAIPVYNELIYLGFNNVFATNGMNIRAIADPVKATISGLNFNVNTIDSISSLNDEQNKRVYFSVYQTDTSTVPDYVIVGDYDSYPEFKWTFYENGPNIATWPSFRVGSFFKLTNQITGVQEAYFGSADTTLGSTHLAPGQYFKMNEGDNDAGLGIYFEIITRPYSMKEPQVKKLFERARIFLTAGDSNYSLSVSAMYDLGETHEAAQELPLIGTLTLWNQFLWNQANWSNGSIDEVTYWGHTRAKFQQLVITQSDANAPVTLLGWGTSAGMQAPK